MAILSKWDDISIYELSLNGVPVYIGSTIDLKLRLYAHKRKIQFDTCTVLEKCDGVARYDTEYMYIQLYKAWGFTLINESDSKNHNTKYLAPFMYKRKRFDKIEVNTKR